MDSIWLLFIILAIVLIVVAILATTVGYFWASSVTKSALLLQLEDRSDAAYKNAQDQLQNWKEKELTSMQKQIYDAAKGQAIQEMQEQVQNWKDKELNSIQKQLYDAAKGQAIQEMQEQVENWKENELKQIRQQMQAGLSGEAIKEAEEQLVKWRNDDLENAKRQIWDVLSIQSKASLEQWKIEAEKEIREDERDNSKSVTTGKMTEHMFPYLPGFGFDPADARFIGNPIDLIVFDGLSAGELKKIVFVEIKTGLSKLSARERVMKDAVINKLVEWLEVKANLEGPEVVSKVKGRKNTGSLLFAEIEIDPFEPPSNAKRDAGWQEKSVGSGNVEG